MTVSDARYSNIFMGRVQAALANGIDWLLEHQDQVVHYCHQLGVDGQL